MSQQEFPAAIVEQYRIRRERLGEGEVETTIPLRAGRGHVYVFSPDHAGVWLNTARPEHKLGQLARDFPCLVVQQVGIGECSFHVPLPESKPVR